MAGRREALTAFSKSGCNILICSLHWLTAFIYLFLHCPSHLSALPPLSPLFLLPAPLISVILGAWGQLEASQHFCPVGIAISLHPVFFRKDIVRKRQEVAVCSPFLLMRTVGPSVGTGRGRDEGADEPETVGWGLRKLFFLEFIQLEYIL